MTAAWPWVALAGLGAFHGLNPAMRWLFAVALGLQRRSRRAVLQSLLPIAAGHALSVALIVVGVAVLRAFVDFTVLKIGAAIALLGFGLYRLFAPHPGRAGMQVSSADLTLWSFLTATVHGAGLMLIPVLFEMPIGTAHAQHGHVEAVSVGSSAATALAAIGVHTLAMLAVTGAVAIVVYDWVGLTFLRRGWINLDLLWALALIGAGVILLVSEFQ